MAKLKRLTVEGPLNVWPSAEAQRALRDKAWAALTEKERDELHHEDWASLGQPGVPLQMYRVVKGENTILYPPGHLIGVQETHELCDGTEYHVTAVGPKEPEVYVPLYIWERFSD